MAALVVAAAGVAPEGPLQSAPEPDSVRLLISLSVLAADSMEGRGVGTAGSERAKRYLERTLAEIGVEPFDGSFRHSFESSRGQGDNLVGLVRGLGEGYVVLSAHFDHEGVRAGEIFNGADDNASGTAAALEIARLAVEVPLRHHLVIALFDAEESGLRGARAFLAAPPVPQDSIRLNVNLDMVARTDGVLWAAGAHHHSWLRPALQRVAATASVQLRLGHDRPNAPEGDDWTGASDHAVFHAEGIPFVYFGVEDHADYHRPTDDFERVDPGEFVAAVHTIHRALRELDGTLASPPGPTPQ